MEKINNNSSFDFEKLPVDGFWNLSKNKELRMHRIHSYPAKFPSFITEKALEYAEIKGLKTKSIADLFCGCGTVAFEAKRNNIDFWGCDINPVATLIAKVKSEKYSNRWLNKYYRNIVSYYITASTTGDYQNANQRLKYWYDNNTYLELSKLLSVIERSLPTNNKYRLFFLCAFSNILKQTSRWLTKSIKPQIDPLKHPGDVLSSFKMQVELMMLANDENDISSNAKSKIITGNVLDIKYPTGVDMIVTSPPYVTSYEYADLHQLSSLWLNYTEDYRELRKGTIGSSYSYFNFDKDVKSINRTGQQVVFSLYNFDKTKACSVAKYYLDMQKVVKICYDMLQDSGMAFFVIGNTEYKGVHINNVKHLAESLSDCGFMTIEATKRKITNKILTPYRDRYGKFTTNRNGRKVYSEEFILCGRKK